jgi:hypothetical protein
VQIATASTAVGALLRGELVVDAKKQGEELRVLQQGMAHWVGLFLLESRSRYLMVFPRSIPEPCRG